MTVVTLRERNTAFDFDHTWTTFRPDQEPFYREHLLKGVEETKAVDIIALHPSQVLLWLEAKDFRAHAIENRERLRTGALMQEMAQKVRDSLACLAAAARAASDPSLWRTILLRVQKLQKSQFVVILLLEEDGQGANVQQAKVRMAVHTKALKKKLHWLNASVAVSCTPTWSEIGSPLGITIRNLPGAGQP